MMRRIKRTKDFEVNLQIKNTGFIAPPTEAQRNVLVNKALSELVHDLNALDNHAKVFVKGNTQILLEDRTQKELEAEEIMEDWQFPVMDAMVDAIASSGGNILEIGFGRGISSDMIQAKNISSHTIIECNDHVIEHYYQPWLSKYPNTDIRLVRGLWQDTIDDLGKFDGIFFHTYPLNEEEYMKYVHGRVTFAEHFFKDAAAHLNPGGAFTYYSNEIDSLSRAHQRALFKYFSSFSLHVIPVEVPEDVKDSWWAKSMAIVKAVK